MAASRGCAREKNARHEASALLMYVARSALMAADADVVTVAAMAELVRTEEELPHPETARHDNATAIRTHVLTGSSTYAIRTVSVLRSPCGSDHFFAIGHVLIIELIAIGRDRVLEILKDRAAGSSSR
jgi:hypothetical protein